MSKRTPKLLLEDIQESAEKIHDYFGVDLQIVWKISFDQLPALILEITKILRSF